VKKQSRVKRKELNKLLGYTVRHLKDKVLVTVVFLYPLSVYCIGEFMTPILLVNRNLLLPLYRLTCGSWHLQNWRFYTIIEGKFCHLHADAGGS